jgi:hypothetical protein
LVLRRWVVADGGDHRVDERDEQHRAEHHKVLLSGNADSSARKF